MNNKFKEFVACFDSKNSKQDSGPKAKSRFDHHGVMPDEFEKLVKRSGLTGKIYLHKIDPKGEFRFSNAFVDKRPDDIERKPKTKWGFNERRVIREVYRNDPAAQAGWSEKDFIAWTLETGYRPEYEFRQVQDGAPGPDTCVWGLFKDVPIEDHVPTDPLDKISAEIGLLLKVLYTDLVYNKRMEMSLDEFTEFVVSQYEAGFVKPKMHLKRIDRDGLFELGNMYFAYKQESGNYVHGFSATDVYEKFHAYVKVAGPIQLANFIEMALSSGFWPGKSQRVKGRKVSYGDPVTERQKAEFGRIMSLWKRPDIQEDFETIENFVDFAVRHRFNFCSSVEKRSGTWVCDIFVQDDYECYVLNQGYVERNKKMRAVEDCYRRKRDALKVRAKEDHQRNPAASDEICQEWSGEEGVKAFKDWCFLHNAVMGEGNWIIRIDETRPFGPDNCNVIVK